MLKKYLPIALVATLMVVVLSLIVAQTPADAQQPSTTGGEVVRTVSVSGVGNISAVPDQATIEIGVRTESKTSEAAVEENNKKMTALIASLKRSGIKDKDIQTRNFSIWPQYGRSSSASDTITGYEVNNTVFITVRALENLGSTLDAAVKAGSNQVNGIQLGFSNPEALLDEAREAAMKEAKRKATQLAELADVKVGAVISISESGVAPSPIMMQSNEAAFDTAPVPIETGESSVSATVQVTYELVP